MPKPLAWFALVAVSVGSAAVLRAVPASPSESPVPQPPQQDDSASKPAKSADVASIDSILSALYGVISGPAGAPRDWDRFYALFVPEGARLIPTGSPRADGNPAISFHSPQDYAERAAGMFARQGFYESEAHREVQRFGRIAHVFSTYESRQAPDAEPFQRGINSIQLMHDADRWWIVSIYWDAETDANPIPDEYAPRD